MTEAEITALVERIVDEKLRDRERATVVIDGRAIHRALATEDRRRQRTLGT